MRQQHERSGRGHTILIFKHGHTAMKAVKALVGSGVARERVSLFVPAVMHDMSEAELQRAMNFGGATGAELGALAGLALFVIPGIGPVLGTGTVAAAVTGAILGGSIGGVTGALAGAGLSEAEASLAEHHLRHGKAVVVVKNTGDDVKLSAISRSKGSVELAKSATRTSVRT